MLGIQRDNSIHLLDTTTCIAAHIFIIYTEISCLFVNVRRGIKQVNKTHASLNLMFIFSGKLGNCDSVIQKFLPVQSPLEAFPSWNGSRTNLALDTGA